MSTLMTSSCSFLLRNEAGTELAKGEAEAKLDNESLSILPKFGEPILLSLADITEILPADYRIDMTLSSRENLAVYDLGYRFGDFVLSLFHLRNEIILKYLLMSESTKKSGIFGDLTLVDTSGTRKQFQECEFRLYETSLVMIPKVGDPIRVHYSSIVHAEIKDYVMSINAGSGEQFIISKLGKELDSTSRDLSAAINALNIQSQSLIKDLLPSADTSTIMGVSRLMKDGKVARSSDIKLISPRIWEDLEKKMEQTPIWNNYEYLKAFARQDKIAIGIKRGLMGDLTGNYLWLLVPIYGENPRYGNAIALEAAKLPSADSKEARSYDGVSAEEDVGATTVGNATYFFRIAGREEYHKLAASTEEIDSHVDSMILRISQLMQDINFRREPIFLSDEKLRIEAKYAGYRYAIQKISSLKQLRELFIGRIIHSSFDQWKSDVTELLLFNMTAKDNAKWQKSLSPAT